MPDIEVKWLGQHVLINEYTLITEMRQITRKYGNTNVEKHSPSYRTIELLRLVKCCEISNLIEPCN